MVRKHRHGRTITKVPAIGQTSLEIKLTGTMEILNTILLADRQSAWKVFFPLDYEPDLTPADPADPGAV